MYTLSRIGTVTEIDPTTPKPVPLDASVTWEDVKWLVGYTKLPVIAKGILRPDDALRAIEAGCKAIWISNHGGRQLDTTPAPVSIFGLRACEIVHNHFFGNHLRLKYFLRYQWQWMEKSHSLLMGVLGLARTS